MRIGIIGGSGLDDPKILQDAKESEVITNFGKAHITEGKIDSKEIIIIARHGKKHNLTPTQVNYRANIEALKQKKINVILSTTACGSLKKEISRGDFVIIDQFIDFTKFRKNTFFEDFKKGINHTPMAEPFDASLRQILINSAKKLNFKMHKKGTVITIEGPRFSTKAESKMFIGFGADIINMSIATEASLANELSIPYASIAMVTDYDCWKEDEESVSWEKVLEIFNDNADRVKQLLITSIKNIKLG